MNKIDDQVTPQPTKNKPNTNTTPQNTSWSNSTDEPTPVKQPKAHPMEEVLQDLAEWVKQVQAIVNTPFNKAADWANDKLQKGLSNVKDSVLDKINNALDNFSDYINNKQQEIKDDPQREPTQEEMKEINHFVKDVSDATTGAAEKNVLGIDEMSPPSSSKTPSMEPAAPDSMQQPSTQPTPEPSPSQNSEDTPNGPGI